jgi:hypothetical protein
MKTLAATNGISETRSASLNPLGLWHLLSLDAPTVAATWTLFIARAAHVALPLFAPAAMFLAVWIIYAADRLVDARRQHNLEARHRFHGRHRTAFQTALALAAIAMLPLVSAMPMRTRHEYLALGGMLLLWLALIHLVGRQFRMPKELAVGFFFSTAVFIPTVSRSSHIGLVLPALFFANLCSLNCLFIYAWEHPPEQRDAKPHATTAFGLRVLEGIAVGSIVLPLAMMPLTSLSGRPILLAASLGAAILLALHRVRTRLDRTDLRAAADLALLSPLLLLPFVS